MPCAVLVKIASVRPPHGGCRGLLTPRHHHVPHEEIVLLVENLLNPRCGAIVDSLYEYFDDHLPIEIE